jgi:hypothetical protein
MGKPPFARLDDLGFLLAKVRLLASTATEVEHEAIAPYQAEPRRSAILAPLLAHAPSCRLHTSPVLDSSIPSYKILLACVENFHELDRGVPEASWEPIGRICQVRTRGHDIICCLPA